jgi:SAM-dependent methyltransferase
LSRTVPDHPRVLVAIANYGEGNRRYLDQLLAEYRAMPFPVDVVVLSNIPKDLGEGVEVKVGLPSKNPWSLPFGHKQLFADRIEQYDAFIYSEDDILVTENNIRAFLEVTPTLEDDEIAGFMRIETHPDGRKSYDMIHAFFRWDPASARLRGGELYAHLTNEHAAAYILTRDHLRRAIDSGGFLVPPHQHRYDLLCTAATDPYTQCGMTKLLPLDRLADFEVRHLPNKYVGIYGVEGPALAEQIDALRAIAQSGQAPTPWIEIETRLPGGGASKPVHDQPDDALLATVPSDAKSVLVIGCGDGRTEAAMIAGGAAVTALPVDPVVGRNAAARGVEVLPADPAEAERVLGSRPFDVVAFPDVLHLVAEPVALLRRFARCVAEGGTVLVSAPNTADMKMRMAKLRGGAGYRELGDFERAGLHATNRRVLRQWLREAGLTTTRVQPEMTDKRQKLARASAGLGAALLANRWLLQAKPAATPAAS